MPQDPALSRKMDKRSNLGAARSRRVQSGGAPPAGPTPYAGGMEFLAFAIGGSALFAIGAMVFAAINRDD